MGITITTKKGAIVMKKQEFLNTLVDHILFDSDIPGFDTEEMKKVIMASETCFTAKIREYVPDEEQRDVLTKEISNLCDAHQRIGMRIAAMIILNLLF